MVVRLHEDEIPIDLGLVRALVDRVMPSAAVLPLTPAQASGSTNAIFRLGAELAVRLPRQPGGSATIDKEARWLPVMASQLPVPVPEIVIVGEPDLGYPERWSIVRWLPGSVPSPVAAWRQRRDDKSGLGADLAAVITALRQIAVDDSALGDPSLHWYRGDPLADMNEQFLADIESCRHMDDLDLDLDTCLAVWTLAMGLPESSATVEPKWYHGDLLAENLLVDSGRLCGLLDFGALSIGNPTVDLVGAWELLDRPGRVQFRTQVGVDDATWLQAMAWTLALAVMTFPYYGATMPDRCSDRLVAAQAVLADFAAL